jgi:hypothetical protein
MALPGASNPGAYHTGQSRFILGWTAAGDPTGNRSGILSLGTNPASVNPKYLAFEKSKPGSTTHRKPMLSLMNYAVVEGSRADQTPLGFVDVEVGVGAGAVGLVA